LTSIKNRGVKDILIITTMIYRVSLPGIEDAIKAAYRESSPEALYQGCVVHLIGNSLKHVSYKDLKEFSIDMKFIYKAPTEESALFFRHSAERELKYLDEFEAKWGKGYPLALRVWDWDRILAQFSIHFGERVSKYI